jgi:hypothetical protein
MRPSRLSVVDSSQAADDSVLIIPRMFSDDAGGCRFDQARLPLTMKEYAPPAAPVVVHTSRSHSKGAGQESRACSARWPWSATENITPLERRLPVINFAPSAPVKGAGLDAGSVSGHVA